MASTKSNDSSGARIKVLGVGGGGGNAVARMMRLRPDGAVFKCMNTDKQALASLPQHMRLILGRESLDGMGAGGEPEMGRLAAEESKDEIRSVCTDADMIFVTAGMGGGTGTGAAPIVSRIAKECGALVIGVVTTPFFFEGKTKRRLAEKGIADMESYVDSLVVVSNDKLLSINGENLALNKAFKLADGALRQAVLAMADVVSCRGEINVDLADVRSVLKTGGRCFFALGQDKHGSAVQAARGALASSLLDTDLSSARKALLVVSGSRRLKLGDVQAASEVVQQSLHPDAHIIFGITTDQSLKDEIRVTLVASAQSSDAVITVETPDTVIADEKMVEDIEEALECSLPLWDTDQQDAAEETLKLNALSGVIRDIDSELREITVNVKNGKTVTLGVGEATELMKEGRETGFERLSVGDKIQDVSMYYPETGMLNKLVVSRGRSF